MIRLRIKEVAEEKGKSIVKPARKADLDSKTMYRIANKPNAEMSAEKNFREHLRIRRIVSLPRYTLHGFRRESFIRKLDIL